MLDKNLLTDQNILDIIEVAGYGGINYWASTADIDEDARTYTITEAGDFGPDDELPEHVVTFDKIRETYWALVDLDQQFCARYIHDYFIDSYRHRTAEFGIEIGSIDAEAADVLMQVAALGKLVYG